MKIDDTIEDITITTSYHGSLFWWIPLRIRIESTNTDPHWRVEYHKNSQYIALLTKGWLDWPWSRRRSRRVEIDRPPARCWWSSTSINSWWFDSIGPRKLLYPLVFCMLQAEREYTYSSYSVSNLVKPLRLDWEKKS